MDPSRSRKPSLPRLTTNVPAARRSSSSLPLVPLATIPTAAAAKVDPNLQKPPSGPILFVDDKKDENVAPFLRYTADVKPPVIPQTMDEPAITKSKTSYYEDTFAVRGAHNSPKERVAQDSVILAELKMNYKRHSKEDGLKFVTDFLFRLSHIYQRSESSIMLTVQENILIAYGSGTTLQAYSLIIYALPSLIAPVTNQRNTTLIQNALQDLLGIPPALGVIVYIPVPEDNLATNGVTVRGEISRLERNEVTGLERNDLESPKSPTLFKTISRGMSRLKTGSGQSAPLSQSSTAGVTSPRSNPRSEPLRSPDMTKPAETMPGEEKAQGLRKRDSLRGLVSRRWMDKGVKGKDIPEETTEATKEVPKDDSEKTTNVKVDGGRKQ